mgnify:CR=1 FL=1
MQIILNGEIYQLQEQITIEHLLHQLNSNVQGMAIAVNCNIIPRSQYSKTFLNDNDKVEVVTAFQGG